MKRTLSMITAFFLMVSFCAVNAFGAVPAQDMRAAWMATVYNIDFPSTKSDAEAQKSEFIQKLEAQKALGMNTVVVQVRPKADALYKSQINPWSDVLTGTQGMDPGYDPMAFMIEEAHKRGMAFHAWLNPYRVTTAGTDINKLSENHPARKNPDWVLSYNNALYYNPEAPGIKEHIVATVQEIVKNYNVDGIHFDDYFYPSNYPLPMGESKDGIAANSRRQTINEMLAAVHTAIKQINSNVKFGVSPMGIWKNSTTDPAGSQTGGNQSYYAVAADTRTWIQNEWIDYVVPQIYWETGHKLADYETLVKWWSSQVNGTKVKLYIGQGIYRDAVAAQIDTQLKINQKYPEVKGSFYYSLKDLLGNRAGCKDKVAAFNKEFPLQAAAPVQTNTGTNAGTNAGTNIGIVQVINKTGIVTAKTPLNIRRGAGTEFNVLAKAAAGSKLTVIKSQGNWYNVKLSTGISGWALSSYVKLENTVNKTNPKTEVSSNTPKTGKVKATLLNVRSGPGTTYSLVTKAASGTQVKLLESKNGWFKIKLADNKIGWVLQSYIAY